MSCDAVPIATRLVYTIRSCRAGCFNAREFYGPPGVYLASERNRRDFHTYTDSAKHELSAVVNSLHLD